MGMTLLSLSAIVVQLTIELLMGIDLFLLGLILCPGRVAVGGRLLVALEAVAYGRRYRPDPSPGVVFLPGLRLGKLNQAPRIGPPPRRIPAGTRNGSSPCRPGYPFPRA